MTISNSEEQANSPSTAAAAKPKRASNPRVAARRPTVSAVKDKPGKKTTPTKKAPTDAKASAGKKVAGAGEGSKTGKVLGLLRRPGGATLKEIMKATAWQPHSVRGFLSGTVGKKMKLTVTSTKSEGGERSYSFKA